MNKRHTPGTWTIKADADKAGLHPLHDHRHVVSHSGIICDLRDQPAQAADARLIAAAPDLLRVARAAAENAAIVTDLLATPGEASKAELVSLITALGAVAREAVAATEDNA
jgi:hypothetical protein